MQPVAILDSSVIVVFLPDFDYQIVRLPVFKAHEIELVVVGLP